MQREKLIDRAVDLRIATLRAEAEGICGITDCGGNREEFLYYNEEDFVRLIKGRDYTIKKHPYNYKYQYRSKISGLTFTCLTNKLLFDGDEIKLEEENNEYRISKA
ncbi:MAG: hypothetical protein WC996_07325 [Peptostreptococcales bacterium]